jgi:hypothetical protein
MNVRFVVLLVLVVVLAGCMGWQPAQVPSDPIVDVKTDDGALGYDDRTPDLSGIENSPPTAVSGVDSSTPAATGTPAPIYSPTPNATTPAATAAGTAAVPNGTATTPDGTDATSAGTPDGTTTPAITATPVGSPTDLPSGEEPTPASTDDE